MSCYSPLLAIKLGQFDGKYLLKIVPSERVDVNIHSLELKYGAENLCFLPCGKCLDCKESHKREWAIRCTLESLYHVNNCMITLTYDDTHVPKKLIKRDLQDFIKSVRNCGLHFRFFGAGEYSSVGRPHYHVLFFGYWPKDAKVSHRSEAGYPVYSSSFLTSIWKKGLIAVSEFTPGTAKYVAGYVDKKLNEGEFVIMSNHPGIGYSYFMDHYVDIYQYDKIVGSFGVAAVPRYFDKLADKIGYDIQSVKYKRLADANYALLKEVQAHGLLFKDSYFALSRINAEIKAKARRKHS